MKRLTVSHSTTRITYYCASTTWNGKINSIYIIASASYKFEKPVIDRCNLLFMWSIFEMASKLKQLMKLLKVH